MINAKLQRRPILPAKRAITVAPIDLFDYQSVLTYLFMMSAFLGAVAAVFLLLHLAFFIAVHFRRNDIADTVWGLGFIAAAIGAVMFELQHSPSFTLGLNEKVLLLCLFVWAFRLAQHIGLRTLHHDQEDARYLKMRQNWGVNWKSQSYFKVFLLQGTLILIIAMPVIQSINNSPHDFSIRTAVGLFIWLFGFIFESISDRQLKKFKADPAHRGKIMDQGLWSWSRHPNYFGEVVQWWGLFLIACTSFATSWTVISPVLITFLILRVSGVPLLEELMAERPGFAEYKKRTAIFFPRPPKN